MDWMDVDLTKLNRGTNLPLNYSQNIPRDGNEDPNDESGPFRRSISQTLLSQLSSPTYQGIASRGASPSPFLNSRNKNRPSIQSLISSFINKVSRGTQTDCDDNFDQLSIASAATGFSTFANDLTKSRIKMFLNDQMTGNHLDETDFVDELSKLRYEINGQFGQKNEDLESLDDRQSLASQYENELNDFATITSSENKSMSAEPAPKQPSPPLKTKKVDPRKMFMDTAMETDRLLTSDISCQVDIEIKPSTSEKYCQTDVIHDEPVVPDRRSICVENRPEQRTIETQTDRFVFCDHCCGSEMLKSDLEKSADNVQTTSSLTNPSVTKYEFIITNANIICKDDSLTAKFSSLNFLENPPENHVFNHSTSISSGTANFEIEHLSVPSSPKPPVVTSPPTSSTNSQENILEELSQNTLTDKLAENVNVETEQKESKVEETLSVPQKLSNGSIDHASAEKEIIPTSSTIVQSAVSNTNKSEDVPSCPFEKLTVPEIIHPLESSNSSTTHDKPSNGTLTLKSKLKKSFSLSSNGKSPIRSKRKGKKIIASQDDGDLNQVNLTMIRPDNVDPKCCTVT